MQDANFLVVSKTNVRNGREMSIKEVLTEYVDFVKPMFEDFIWPVSLSFVAMLHSS